MYQQMHRRWTIQDFEFDFTGGLRDREESVKILKFMAWDHIQKWGNQGSKQVYSLAGEGDEFIFDLWQLFHWKDTLSMAEYMCHEVLEAIRVKTLFWKLPTLK